MNLENQGNEPIAEIAEIKQETEKEKPKKEAKPQKELSPQEIQKRKKMLVYPLFALIFIGAMWLIFAPSGAMEEQTPDGFNPELPVPKDDDIVGDKRTAYEQEAQRHKDEEKRRSLEDFAFMLGSEEERKMQEERERQPMNVRTDLQTVRNNSAIHSSSFAYKDVNKQLDSWYNEPATDADGRAQREMQQRIDDLERKLEESESGKSTADEQLALIEKSYAIAAKYMPNPQAADAEATERKSADNSSMREKVIPEPVAQVRHNEVSLLAAPMDNETFLQDYSQPRNMGFITTVGKEAVTDKNSIRACVYRTTKLSDGKEIQLRLLESVKAGDILIPANTLLTGSTKMGGERLTVTIHSIQYADNVIPVEMELYDMDGLRGFSAPASDEVNAAKEIAANMGTSMGSSITISDDAGSQLAADLGRSAIQGASQYIGKKMRKVEITVKANHRVLLMPKI